MKASSQGVLGAGGRGGMESEKGSGLQICVVCFERQKQEARMSDQDGVKVLASQTRELCLYEGSHPEKFGQRSEKTCFTTWQSN